jgi:hypothetical protein
MPTGSTKSAIILLYHFLFALWRRLCVTHSQIILLTATKKVFYCRIRDSSFFMAFPISLSLHYPASSTAGVFLPQDVKEDGRESSPTKG